MSKKIGILTGGGDAPGLNQVIRAAVFYGVKNFGYEFVAIEDGWKGLLEGKSRPLTIDEVRDWIYEGGTLIGSSRTNPFKRGDGGKICRENFEKMGLDAIIALGGEDTLGVAYRLYREYEIPTVGAPKTIDNDLPGTDQCFGFDTAINRVMEAFDRLRTTARSHHRILVVEVMGRHAGWMTLVGGLAGGADIILLPEEPFDLDQVAEQLKKLREQGRHYALVAVSEGAKLKFAEGMDIITQDAELDEFGHVRLGGIAKVLAKELQKRTNWEARHVVLGHLQRGGAPTAFDRWFATQLGAAAVEQIAKDNYGVMVVLKGSEIVPVSLEEAAKGIRTVPEELLEFKKIFEP
ncbi:ATP-dependent 6-phosphofructokinase [bacterium]|nr:ATP-dependent 6-phosphofructokinase [bacterium]